MKELNFQELVAINGGCPDCKVSTNQNVQGGYSVGYHIGQTIGQTISDVGSIIKNLSPFNWIK